MIAVAGAGQTDTAWKPSLTDSIYLSGGGGGLAIDTLTKNGTTRFSAVGSWYGGSGMIIQTHEPKYDTVAIVYLYADTTVFCRDSIRNKEVEVGRRWFTYWDFGYEVRQEAGTIPVTSSENSMMYDWLMSYKFIGYLDRQKNPIRKGVIIWITKNK